MDIIGIDPGLTGAIARYNGETLVVEDMPIVEAEKRGTVINYDGLRDIMNLMFAGADHCYVEQVHSMPKQGVSSSFKFGTTYGGIIMAVAMLEIPRTLISPVKWKMELGLNSDKEKSRKRALELFPKYAHMFALKKHKDRAEASLLAWYGYMMKTVGRVR